MQHTKIFLIRHGQTDYNLQGIVQGSGVDTSINETGRKQSLAFFNKYKDVSFDRIYTSVLQRSAQSVQPFIDLGITWEKHEGLNEISWGNNDGTKISVAEHAVYNDVIKSWQEGDLELKMAGGESPMDVYRRQVPVYELIKKREDDKIILICMHGRAMRIFLCLLLNVDLIQMERFLHHNLCLYQLDLVDGVCSLKLENDISHLENN